MSKRERENQTQRFIEVRLLAYVPVSRTLLEYSQIHYWTTFFRVKIKPLQSYLHGQE